MPSSNRLRRSWRPAQPARPGSVTGSGSQPRRSFLCPLPDVAHRSPLFVKPIDQRRQRLERGRTLGASRPRSSLAQYRRTLGTISTTARTFSEGSKALERYSAHACYGIAALGSAGSHSCSVAGASCARARTVQRRRVARRARYHGAGCVSPRARPRARAMRILLRSH
jgi:hypothetical protein